MSEIDRYVAMQREISAVLKRAKDDVEAIPDDDPEKAQKMIAIAADMERRVEEIESGMDHEALNREIRVCSSRRIVELLTNCINEYDGTDSTISASKEKAEGNPIVLRILDQIFELASSVKTKEAGHYDN